MFGDFFNEFFWGLFWDEKKRAVELELIVFLMVLGNFNGS
jgi:hypothetical protein